MSKIYSYDDMEKLSQKIQKIKKKKNLEEIRDIIINNNSNLNVTENSHGIYLCFNELSNETYLKLEKYVKKYFDNGNNAKTTSEFNYMNSSVTEEDTKFTKYSQENYLYENNSRLKFSNKEKNLIKKRLYDKALKINSEVNNYENNLSINMSESNEESKNNTQNNPQNNAIKEQNNDNNKIFIKKNKKVDK